ncbi:DNA-binding response regulator, OmpR family, contains REC and winged-helix (wHTH) domain [Paenibacillaceae bacterium GAS479]|nr:DNA-binding response regulator, OmpR family, contains REC and winged-helix (wHTH) domain [Paenibacillaceae bacterium GAS479]
MNVLIADDDPDMLGIVSAYFRKEGFHVLPARNGQEALELSEEHKIDLAVLDWMMPQRSGIEVCRELKRQQYAKVILLTAKSAQDDELKALESGADDYVRKPFEPRILILRAKKLLHLEDAVTLGSLRVDLRGGKIYRDGMDLEATTKEFQILKCLIEHKGQILSRKALLDQVWGYDYLGEERTVDTHIRRLREKVGESLIKTHRGSGYSLGLPDE